MNKIKNHKWLFIAYIYMAKGAALVTNLIIHFFFFHITYALYTNTIRIEKVVGSFQDPE